MGISGTLAPSVFRWAALRFVKESILELLPKVNLHLKINVDRCNLCFKFVT